MSYNLDLENTNIPARVAIIVFLNQAQDQFKLRPVSYTHLTLPTNNAQCRSRWSPYH